MIFGVPHDSILPRTGMDQILLRCFKKFEAVWGCLILDKMIKFQYKNKDRLENYLSGNKRRTWNSVITMESGFWDFSSPSRGYLQMYTHVKHSTELNQKSRKGMLLLYVVNVHGLSQILWCFHLQSKQGRWNFYLINICLGKKLHASDPLPHDF